MLAYLYWNPPREAFYIPYFDHPVTWYGICFVLGFVLSYYVMLPMFKNLLNTHYYKPYSNDLYTVDQMSGFLLDRLCMYVVIGTIIGARLGTVLFYDWDYYSAHPLEIFKTWKGGLASHGAAIGILIALYLYNKSAVKWVPEFKFVHLLDMIAVVIPLAAFFIRMGNFINQEILGIPTSLPWGIIFGHPADGSLPVPRHPVQLYEGFTYLCIFGILYTLWKYKKESLKPGVLFGLMLTLIFSTRFILEFWKSEQYSSLGEFSLQMGQLLSLPFIAAGIIMLFWKRKAWIL